MKLKEVDIISDIESKKAISTVEYFNDKTRAYIFEQKYALTKEDGTKETPGEVFWRVAKALSLGDDELAVKWFYGMWNREYLPAGSIIYGAGNPHKISLMNCSYRDVTSVSDDPDSIEAIFDCAKMISRGYARRQGVGTDVSYLRPRGAPTHNAAKTTTGAVSWMEIFDKATDITGQQGRRGALMITIHDWHPDVLEFVNVKNDLNKILNANISVKLSDAFFKSVENNDLWYTEYYTKSYGVLMKIDGKEYICKSVVGDKAVVLGSKDRVIQKEGDKWNIKYKEIEIKDKSNVFVITDKKEIRFREGDPTKIKGSKGIVLRGEPIKARKLLRNIATSAYKSAEPGVLYWDTMTRESNSNYLRDDKYKIKGVNPCSEIALPNGDVCCLGHINLATIPTENGYEEIERRAKEVLHMLDNAVEYEYINNLSPFEDQRETISNLRRVGVGFTGLADYFIKRGIKYDSEEAVVEAEKVQKHICKATYEKSIELGRKKSSFPASIYSNLSPFLKRIANEFGFEEPELLMRRNVCTMTVAPTGTVSLILGTYGSGIEPGMGPYYWRRTRVGGDYEWFFEVTPFIRENMKEDITDLINKVNSTKNIEKKIELEEKIIEKINNEIDTSLFVSAHDVDPFFKIKLMAAVTKWNDQSISVTYNMDGSKISVQDVEKLIVEGYKSGLKCLSVYVDHPDNRAPIISFVRPYKMGDSLGLSKPLKKRPRKLQSYTYKTKANGSNYYITVSLHEGKLVECFINTNHKEAVEEVKYYVDKLYDLAREYDKLQKNKIDKFIEEDREKAKGAPSHVKLGRAISLALRHTVPVEEIIEVLNENSPMVTSVVFQTKKILSDFISPKKTGESCPNCGEELVNIGGCIQCFGCGWGKCG